MTYKGYEFLRDQFNRICWNDWIIFYTDEKGCIAEVANGFMPANFPQRFHTGWDHNPGDFSSGNWWDSLKGLHWEDAIELILRAICVWRCEL